MISSQRLKMEKLITNNNNIPKKPRITQKRPYNGTCWVVIYVRVAGEMMRKRIHLRRKMFRVLKRESVLAVIFYLGGRMFFFFWFPLLKQKKRRRWRGQRKGHVAFLRLTENEERKIGSGERKFRAVYESRGGVAMEILELLLTTTQADIYRCPTSDILYTQHTRVDENLNRWTKASRRPMYYTVGNQKTYPAESLFQGGATSAISFFFPTFVESCHESPTVLYTRAI